MNTEKNTELLSAIEMNPTTKAKAVIIWLHGLGASGDDFVPLVPELLNLTQLPLRFVFPHAPERPVTINNGYVMPAWYDIISFDKDGVIDHEGISFSVRQVKALIQEELKRGFQTKDLILAGFSQGAVIALNTLLNYPEPLGGIIALSGYLPATTVRPTQTATPVFLGHGRADEIVPFVYGEAAQALLVNAGYDVTWRTYPMAHSVCGEEVGDLAKWLKGVLG